jgi:hypothetical protein
MKRWYLSIGWSKCHTTNNKLFIYGCNLIQFGLINKHCVAVTIQKATCNAQRCNLPAPVRQLSSNVRNARMPFSHVQAVSIVKHYTIILSYLTYRDEFKDTFPHYLVPKNRQYLKCSTVSGHSRNSSPGSIRHQGQRMGASPDAVDISKT